MIERTAFPTTAAMTAKEIADWIKIDPGSDPDTTNILLSSATEYVEGQTGVAIVSSSYRMTEFGFCGSYIDVPISPVQSITAVNATLAGQVTPITGATLVTGIRPRIVFAQPIIADVLTIDLVAGYSTIDAAPLALRHAVAVLVSAGYNNREAMDPATFATVANLIARNRRFF